MRGDFYKQLTSNLETARAEGLFKEERIITSAQQADITVGDSHVINFCANNYLGLANHPELIAAAKSGMDSHGFGMASVRFICGTQDTHKQLEKKLADFLGMEDAILYSSCFDANGGLFETLLGPEDAIISDALNHASIIDGVRLCKAKRFRYANNDMQELEARLKEAREAGARHVLIATDVAARGIDIPDVSHVFNFDMPRTADTYLHRIGRTGRAGKKGTAISLVEAHDHLLLGKIGRYIEEPLKARVIDELRPTTRAPSEKLTGKPSKKVLAKRAQKKKDEKEKPRVKKRHRDTKNIGKRRKPSAAGTPSASSDE